MNITYDIHDVDLPNPNLEDMVRFSDQSVRKVMPNGQLKTFKDPDWPVIETFIYDLYRLNQTQRDDLIALLNAGAGLQVTITDHLGAIRIGYIVTPVNEILTIRDNCWYDVHFEFMTKDLVNPIADCHQLPTPTDDTINMTIDDLVYYRMYAEDDTLIDAEDDDDIWIEGY